MQTIKTKKKVPQCSTGAGSFNLFTAERLQGSFTAVQISRGKPFYSKWVGNDNAMGVILALEGGC